MGLFQNRFDPNFPCRHRESSESMADAHISSSHCEEVAELSLVSHVNETDPAVSRSIRKPEEGRPAANIDGNETDQQAVSSSSIHKLGERPDSNVLDGENCVNAHYPPVMSPADVPDFPKVALVDTL